MQLTARRCPYSDTTEKSVSQEAAEVEKNRRTPTEYPVSCGAYALQLK